MNALAHPISIRHNRDDAQAHTMNATVAALLVVLALAAVVSLGFTVRSLSSQLETARAAQVTAAEQAAASGAYAACVGSHGADAAAKCRAAASTFAFGDSAANPAAFDKAVAYLYPQKR